MGGGNKINHCVFVVVTHYSSAQIILVPWWTGAGILDTNKGGNGNLAFRSLSHGRYNPLSTEHLNLYVK